MRQRKKLAPKKVVTATANQLQFIEGKKISTKARVDQLLILLEIDKSIHGFKQCLQKFDRLQRNKHGLL
jgi:hypothetical protein